MGEGVAVIQIDSSVIFSSYFPILHCPSQFVRSIIRLFYLKNIQGFVFIHPLCYLIPRDA